MSEKYQRFAEECVKMARTSKDEPPFLSEHFGNAQSRLDWPAARIALQTRDIELTFPCRNQRGRQWAVPDTVALCAMELGDGRILNEGMLATIIGVSGETRERDVRLGKCSSAACTGRSSNADTARSTSMSGAMGNNSSISSRRNWRPRRAASRKRRRQRMQRMKENQPRQHRPQPQHAM